MSSSFLILGAICIIILGYYFLRRKNKYWADRGVPFIKPKLLVGNMSGVGSKISIFDFMKNSYDELKDRGPVGGMFFFTEPAALIVDLDILRHVFVKDFDHFHDRGLHVNERDDPLSAHLFNLPGAPWRSLRAKLSPTFTSGKMKMMHPTILGVADQFRDHLLSLTASKRSTEVEFKEVLTLFTTDVIGNVAFGVECNSLKDPNSEFRRIGRKILEPSAAKVLKESLVGMFPKVAKYLRVITTAPEVTQFFRNLLSQTIKFRGENDVQRNDFMSLLLQIKNTGRLEGEPTELGTMTFDELAAQMFLFFIAGFETTAATMAFLLYELALNEDVQERARDEIQEVLERYGGEMTYEAAMELKYLDQAIQETLRKYPVADPLLRTVTIPYKVPNTDIYLEKGTMVMVPGIGFHYDPEIFPQPEKFDPERFTKENVASRHPLAWMPFGHGPRNCVGLRFGMMQTRLGIAMVLRNFKISPSQKTMIPVKFDPASSTPTPLGGMFLNITPLK